MKALRIFRGKHAWTDIERSQALADAYRPILRGFLLPGCAYYIFVTYAHWGDESGIALAILAGISALTALAYGWMRQKPLNRSIVTLGRLELCGLATNLLMFSNVFAYMLLHFEAPKLIYFVLMAVVFSTSGVTLRLTIGSILVSIGAMFWFSRHASPELQHQFAFIGVATSFAAFGMASLLRRAMVRQVEARLLAARLAATDPLTLLPNRRSVFDRLENLVSMRKPFRLGIVDLDGFKAINDIYGHIVGDQLLVSVADRLRSIAKTGVFIGRIGGDEFALIIEDEMSAEETQAFGDGLIAAITEPYAIHFLRLSVGASAGFSHFPETGATCAELYEKADFALYKAKKNSRGRSVLFDIGENVELQQNNALERALREADLESELYLVFQPQMHLAAKEIRSFEALARWNSAVLGPVRPDLFICAAERAGLIHKVTDILFSKMLETLARWPTSLSMSFNLSAQDVSDTAFTQALIERIQASGIAPERVEFEITETAVMTDLPAARESLRLIAGAGCRIALDDFGSGYSSFAYLDQLPLNKVKIDKSFVRKVADSPSSRQIVAAIITLCRNLDLRCVLEGVETEQEMDILSPLMPDIIQGYLFGRPMSEADAMSVAATTRAA
ncbi:EAL domain-containing protein [Rhizobium sp. FKL33]|uniref:putative bifunctional diguanylate cyclase/phosphodiesterase n=1 Tax=Rhizobium sp. FKL33 TaxID=2562307 RepID=UPI001980EF1C|nr:EAL domain-containing protein [Rhizobium sp. FKL33]